MTDYKTYHGGTGWRPTETGPIEVKGQGTPMSKGAPTTMMTLFLEHGDDIREACEVTGVPIPWLAGMIPIEAARLKGAPRGSKTWREALEYVTGDHWRKLVRRQADLPALNRFRFDPISLRLEPGYFSPLDTPRRCSAGLTQCLVTTAQQVADHFHWHVEFRGERRPLCIGDLMDPRRSLFLGAGYMRMLMDRYDEERIAGLDGEQGLDFVLLTGAYNAGSVRRDRSLNPTKRNPFNIITYSRTRTQRAIEWHNDCYRPEVAALWKS